MARPEAAFRNPEEWTDKSYPDRRDDVRAIMKILRDSAALADRVDLNQLGLVGHSLGGYTVLGVAGAWTSWKTTRGARSHSSVLPRVSGPLRP